MTNFEEDIKFYNEAFDHNFDWQNFDLVKPPKRGYYDILELEEDDGKLHLMSGFYSAISDVWVVYPFWVKEGTLKFWAKNPLDPDDNNIEQPDEIEYYDFMDVKASLMSKDDDLYKKLSDEFDLKYGKHRAHEIFEELK